MPKLGEVGIELRELGLEFKRATEEMLTIRALPYFDRTEAAHHLLLKIGRILGRAEAIDKTITALEEKYSPRGPLH
jgi:hypothetical protein